MFNRLTIGEVERARLVLRGGSVLDWRRLNVSSIQECNTILRANEFDPESPDDADRLAEIRFRAIDYLKRNLGFSFAPEVVNISSTSDLMLVAAGGNPVLQPQACMILKIMHVIHYIDTCELRANISLSDHDLYRKVEEKARGVINEMKELGFPIVEFKSSHKTLDSLVTKLLSKKQTIKARIFDMIRFRIITKTADDIFPIVVYMTHHLFPFNYTVSGESHNNLFDFNDFIQRYPDLVEMIPQLQVDLSLENEMYPNKNAETSRKFRTVNFVVDLPIRLDLQQSTSMVQTKMGSSGIIHVPMEFQIVDHASHIRNTRGEASHQQYKARRLTKIRERLLRGQLIWIGKDTL